MLSDQVTRYFEKRGTHPYLVTYRKDEISDESIESLKSDIHNLEAVVGVELIAVEECEGEFWKGVLAEFTSKDVPAVDQTGSYNQNKKSLFRRVRDISSQYKSSDRSDMNVRTGDSVASSSSIQSLGEEYFSL